LSGFKAFKQGNQGSSSSTSPENELGICLKTVLVNWLVIIMRAI